MIEIIIGKLIQIVLLVFITKFCYSAYKKEKENIYKMLYFVLLVSVIMLYIIHFLDQNDIPTKYGWVYNVDSQNWLLFLGTYIPSIISAFIGAVFLIAVTREESNYSTMQNNKRENENLRIQNMPLLKYECKEKMENDKEKVIGTYVMNTVLENGIFQTIDLYLKNIGLNTIRKTVIKIKSDVLDKEYFYELGKQSLIEKGQEVIVEFLLKLNINTSYKFYISIYYQDLLFNNYEQQVILEYNLSNYFSKSQYDFSSNIEVNNEKLIKKLPKNLNNN